MPFVFIIVTLSLFVIIFVAVFVYGRKRLAAEKRAWEVWAQSIHAIYMPTSDPSILVMSSFNEGQLVHGMQLVVPDAGNSASLLIQSETRGSGKNKQTYNRSILAIEIPDTKLHLIINSKINNDASSGGNIASFAQTQRFSLEGDFGDFYDIYMPDTTQSETLSMLTPDSMLYLLENLIDYDIEINGSKLYLYAYRHVSAAEAGVLLTKVPKMLEEMRLRKDDVRTQNVTNALVARTATGAIAHRGLKKDVKVLSIVTAAIFVVVQFVQHPIVLTLFGCIILILVVQTARDAQKEKQLRKKYNETIAHHKI